MLGNKRLDYAFLDAQTSLINANLSGECNALVMSIRHTRIKEGAMSVVVSGQPRYRIAELSAMRYPVLLQ